MSNIFVITCKIPDVYSYDEYREVYELVTINAAEAAKMGSELVNQGYNDVLIEVWSASNDAEATIIIGHYNIDAFKEYFLKG